MEPMIPRHALGTVETALSVALVALIRGDRQTGKTTVIVKPARPRWRVGFASSQAVFSLLWLPQ